MQDEQINPPEETTEQPETDQAEEQTVQPLSDPPAHIEPARAVVARSASSPGRCRISPRNS